MMDVPGDGGDNLILIGMPGVGKSTIGVLLAKRMGFDFLDTDLLIQRLEECRLQELILRHGLEGFCDLEARVLCGIDARRTVIATGGSVVYRSAAMDHLRKLGRLLHLHIPLEPLETRLANLDERGVVRLPGQTFATLYAQRAPLYHRYAQMTVDTDGCTPEQVINRALALLSADSWFAPLIR